MKTIAVALLALVAVVHSKSINLEDVVDLEDLTAYDYHNKIGIPLANEIREYESQPQSRVAGGSHAIPGQFPYQAGLLAQLPMGQGVCGGVLISSNRVATAAHCWFDGRNQARSFTVVLGSITLFSGGVRLTSNDVEMHASWNPSLIRDDVAIISITNVGFNANIQAIDLPSGNLLDNQFVGQIATVSGFGRTGDGLGNGITQAQRLSFVDLPVISNADCARSFNIVVDSTICTSGAGGRSACGGDSGGPLVVNAGGRRTLIGIVSFGSALGCTRGFPAAFARVTSFAAWFRARM